MQKGDKETYEEIYMLLINNTCYDVRSRIVQQERRP